MITGEVSIAENTEDFEPQSFIYIEGQRILAMYAKKIEIWDF